MIPSKEIDTDVHGGEARAAGVDDVLSAFSVGEGHRVDDDIQAVPYNSEFAKNSFDIIVASDITGDYQSGMQ